AHRILWHRLPERDRRGLYWIAAVRAVGCSTGFFEQMLHPREVVSLAATDAAGVGRVAVQFDHVIGLEARRLMQIVDVLRDDAGNLAGSIERRKRAMPATGLGCCKRRFHRKAATPGLVARFLAGDKFVERDRPVACPQPSGRTE